MTDPRKPFTSNPNNQMHIRGQRQPVRRIILPTPPTPTPNHHTIRTADITGLAQQTHTNKRPTGQWLQWLMLHGIPNHELLLHPAGTITCDDHARTITYTTWHNHGITPPGRPAAGMHLANTCDTPQRIPLLRPTDTDICVRTVRIQLEAPALPMPETPPPWHPTGPGAYTLTTS